MIRKSSPELPAFPYTLHEESTGEPLSDRKTPGSDGESAMGPPLTAAPKKSGSPDRLALVREPPGVYDPGGGPRLLECVQVCECYTETR